jgi:16S rRNA (uracil1498-N3)-methyltransferase
MKQLLLPGWYAGEPRITLAGAEFRHLARARRMRQGDVLDAVDGRGKRYCLRILRVGREACEAALAPLETPPGVGRPRTRITLLQCLPKGNKIDLIVRQATEAGVARVVLLVSERVVARPRGTDHRAERLRRVAREAVQQSGVVALPQVEGPLPFPSISSEGWGTALLFHERPVVGRSLHALLAEGPQEVSLLVGPEGGLSEAEVQLARASGFQPVHFETGVLRVETAATFALGAVTAILQERDEWTSVREG